jgi:hypothetical protein
MVGIGVIIWLVGLLASIRFIVKPKPDWPFVSTRGRAFGLGLVIFFGIPLILGISNNSSPPSSASPSQTQSASTPVASAGATNADATPAAAPATPTYKWVYSEDTDQMRGTKTKYATLESEDELDLGFPYGSGKSSLTVRQRPSDGLNIILQAKGQFLCSQFNSEHVSAKFDDHPIENYECNEPSDASTGVLFIEGGRRFLGRLKGAKTLILEAPFYQHGRLQMTFDVRGLVWK